MRSRKILWALLAAVVLVSLAACGGPEEKRDKFFTRAKEFFGRGEFVKARLEVKNALQVDPKFAAGYQLLGQIEQKEGNLKAASDAFGRAVDLDPGLSLAQVELGKLQLVGGAAEKAMERAQKVLSTAPEHVEALMLKGSVLLVRKEAAGAVRIFEQLLAKGERRPELYLVLASATPAARTPSGPRRC
jgi:Tfp pilus assembly protein PilF